MRTTIFKNDNIRTTEYLEQFAEQDLNELTDLVQVLVNDVMHRAENNRKRFNFPDRETAKTYLVLAMGFMRALYLNLLT